MVRLLSGEVRAHRLPVSGEQSFGPMWPTRSLGPALRVALIAIALLGPTLWAWLVLANTVGDGTVTFPRDKPGWSSAGVYLADVIEPSGLEAGDCVVAVEGVTLDDWAAGLADVEFRFTRGETATYTVMRQDKPEERACTGDRINVEVALGNYPIQAMVRRHLPVAIVPVYLLAVGVVVFGRRPDDRAARALFVLAAVIPFGAISWPFGPQVIDIVGGDVWRFAIGDACYALTWGALLHFTMVFPQPLPVLIRRPALAAGAFLLPFVLYGVNLLVAIPVAESSLQRTAALLTVSIGAAWVCPPLIAACLAANYRAADEVARRWMRSALYLFTAAAAAYLGFGQIPVLISGTPLVDWDWLFLAFLPCSLILAAAIMRYGLFDIQVVMRRSLVYGALVAIAVALYVVVFAAIGAVAGYLGAGDGAVPIIATAVAAVAVQPLRTRLRRTVTRLLYGTRDDPTALIARLSRRLESSSASDPVPHTIVETLAHALRLAYARIDLFLPDGAVESTDYGTPAGAPVSIPLTHRGAQVGRLVLDVGPTREPLGAADRRLLEALTHQVGATAHNVILTRQLQRSLERVVTAREEERRRLRRDLHDGLGPTLAATAMQMEVAHQLVRQDADRAAAVLGRMLETHRSVISDLRRLVEGLRPPVLDQLGLISALRQHADQLQSPLDNSSDLFSITVDAAADIEPLPAAVEVAAYHICLEAMTNVIRHSTAHTCTVRLWRDNSALVLQIDDDGKGLSPDVRAGVGLNSMRERANEVGGAYTVTPSPHGGTTIRAALPIPGPPP